MSVVIAIKENDHIVMGCDSQATYGQIKTSFLKDNNACKIWNINNLNNSLMGCVGSCRDSQLIQIQENLIDELTVLKDKVDYKYVVETMFTTIYNLLVKYNCVNKNENGYLVNYINSNLIFAYKDKAFLIYSNGAVVEIEDYLVIGSGEEIAIGSLENSKGKPAYKRIKDAIKACSNTTIYIDNNVVIKKTGGSDE